MSRLTFTLRAEPEERLDLSVLTAHRLADIDPTAIAALRIGCDRLTISPNIMEELSQDTGNLPRRLSPDSPGTPPPLPGTDERSFRWAMNEDAMATEKLSEGIRIFNADLTKLRKVIGEKL